MPPRSASAAIAGLLGIAVLIIAPRRGGVVRTLARLGIAGVLGLRSVLDAQETTTVLGRPRPGRTFRELDVRYYRPLCAVLAISTTCSALGTRRASSVGRPHI